MDSAPIQKPTMDISENELLKKEIEELKKEIKILKENCIYKIKIDTLTPKDLLVSGGKVYDEYIRVEKNGIQYGPYKHYEQGKYLIEYYGENLMNAKYDSIDNGIENPILPVNFIIKSPKKVVYEVIIPGNLKSGIEFRAKDVIVPIQIHRIEVFKYNI